MSFCPIWCFRSPKPSITHSGNLWCKLCILSISHRCYARNCGWFSSLGGILKPFNGGSSGCLFQLVLSSILMRYIWPLQGILGLWRVGSKESAIFCSSFLLSFQWRWKGCWLNYENSLIWCCRFCAGRNQKVYRFLLFLLFFTTFPIFIYQIKRPSWVCWNFGSSWCSN